MDRQLIATAEGIKAAQLAQVKRLKQLYPLGTRWAFYIMYGQKNPSTGEVTGYVPTVYGGYVIFDHDQAKDGSRYRCREVLPENILIKL